MKMKHFSIAGVSAIALVASISFASQIPVVANIFEGGIAIARNSEARGPVKLNLNAAKKVVKEVEGKKQVAWQQLEGNVKVQPGDELRYTVIANNNGDKAIKNLNINQPIPKGMVFVKESATVDASKGAKISYSIDGGKNFVKNPTVKVELPNGEIEERPAPASAYTHIRWNFGKSVAANTKVNGTYQLRVQ